MRVLMTGGGTGGHVYPALAIAELIKMNDPEAEIAFVGTEKGIENRLVPKEGYKLYHVQIQGIRRSLSPSNLKTAYLILVSPGRAKKIIREFRPDIVIGTGGYACWPLLKAAASMGIPTVVHESNALPGLAVRQLQGKIDLILTNFADTVNLLKAKEKVVNVGNPLRKTCATVSREDARKALGIPDHVKSVILSFGGSLGAPSINEAAADVMDGFSARREDVMHFHATGSKNVEQFRGLKVRKQLPETESVKVSDYIYDMPTYMAAADLVICRAGAMTLTEVARMKKAAILIPSPYVTDNHQYKNAKVLADAGAACLIEEKDLSADRIVEAVKDLLEDRERRDAQCKAVAAFANPDVEKRIWQEITGLLRRKSLTSSEER